MSINVLAEYHTMDKDDWGEGPWQGEPDKIVWIDGATDLDCMVKRGSPHIGALCGYVGVPPGHPWHGKTCDWDSDFNPEVHGGVTFTNSCQEDGDPAESICHVPQEGRTGDVWWVGFDCGHSMDICPAMNARERAAGFSPPEMMSTYRDLAYVISECEGLARQAAEVSA